MFKYLIIIRPLGFLYGSAGAFLSPENLVGRSGEKFPPSAATISGLFFNANKTRSDISQAEKDEQHRDLKENLYVAGAFWAQSGYEQNFYVPIPWHYIIDKDQEKDEWILDEKGEWQRQRQYKEDKDKLEPAFTWQTINSWGYQKPTCKKSPWYNIPILHPKMKDEERHTLKENGLFLENAVQMQEDTCLIYLSSHKLADGWYRFGGEKHLVEIESTDIKNEKLTKLLEEPIQQAFAIITPAVWGSTRFSFRVPQHPDFPINKDNPKLLTDKAIPYRYSTAGRLGRGRYAVPPGSVYVLEKTLDLSWSQFPDDWFPDEGFSLKRIGSGLCLPIHIVGLGLEKVEQGVA
ncbi:CRISPR-associated protein [Scytonema hofmannii PCC 7110]|uniref:CRISPR-associated protein n=1 Tax=Scytonema hofmannii PCC 7110 TaxID=128403 RepID=A0A139X1R5_9CYAN|nr:type III-B CRISPR module-associated Cmr3 family protein [Scytonema hofmannii]KYC38641.1 CRISPR-associated protein [Scytonema hofmannii PCC 7110]